MTQLLITTVLAISSITCLGQSLFFDHLENSLWMCDSSLVDSTLSKQRAFGLAKLNAPKDSIRVDQTIWYFGDSLTLVRYHATTQNETPIGTYVYKQEDDALIIIFDQDAPSLFSVGIVSTGNFAVLTKREKKTR